MKKLASVMLTMVMVLAMALPVSAEEPKYTLTLNEAFAGHTYTAYQIFKGDLSGDVLSNIVWGSGVTEAGQTALGNAAEKAETIEKAANAEAFAKEVAPYLGTAAGTATVATGATTCTISGLEAGYYLVKTTNVTAQNGVYTYYIMKVVKDTTAKIKAGVPQVDKTVDKSNVNIGDTVTFTLTGTMPSKLDGYKTYKVVFHDTMSEGLTYTNNVKVTIDDVDKTSSFTVEQTNGNITVSCNNVLALGATVNSKIVVTYTAVLNEKAVIGTAGNPNKVYLEYSNDPNWNGTGTEPTGKTPEDEVKVYTWELPVFKYTNADNNEKTPLAGAGFTLYTDESCTNAVNVVAASGNVYKVCTKTGCEHTHVTEIVTDATGKFEIEGLAQGTYYLKETTTPASYNTVDVIKVVIGENGAITVNNENVSTVEVLNQKGATLPSTGGTGTTVLYLVGGALVLIAVVLMVTKKRMSAEK